MNNEPSKPVTLAEAQQATVSPPKPDRMAADEEKMFAHEENMQNAQLGREVREAGECFSDYSFGFGVVPWPANFLAA